MWSLPINSYSESTFNNFNDYFIYLLDDYYEKAVTLKIFNEQKLDKLENICTTLKDVISIYLDGYPGESYNVFVKLMNSLTEDFLNLSATTYTQDELKDIQNSLDNFDLNNTKSNELKSILDDIIKASLVQDSTKDLYRLRTNTDSKEAFSRMDLFHIAFDDYTKIKNYRFSIAGYPCLYLGSSFKVCYKELGEPKLEDIWTMKYTCRKNFKFIDLTKSPKLLLSLLKELYSGKNEIYKLIMKTSSEIFDEFYTITRDERRVISKACKVKPIEIQKLRKSIMQGSASIVEVTKLMLILIKNIPCEDEKERLDIKKDISKLIDLHKLYLSTISKLHNELKQTIIVYPLQLAATIKKNDNSVFTPEYIIPQFLIQWIRKNHDFIGVKYLSTQLDNNADSKNHYNFAIPARSKNNNYCSDLLDLFELSDPVKVIEKIGLSNLIDEISNSFELGDFSKFNFDTIK